eukprot:11085793-Prorocentrum_lima.AAC.1
MRLRGGDPGEESDRFELRLATGIQRLAQLRSQSSLPNNKLTDVEYDERNLEWNDVKVHLGVLRCLDQTMCA